MGLKWDVYHLPTGFWDFAGPSTAPWDSNAGWDGNGRAILWSNLWLSHSSPIQQALESLTTLWVKVTRFEARHERSLVSSVGKPKSSENHRVFMDSP